MPSWGAVPALMEVLHYLLCRGEDVAFSYAMLFYSSLFLYCTFLVKLDMALSMPGERSFARKGLDAVVDCLRRGGFLVDWSSECMRYHTVLDWCCAEFVTNSMHCISSTMDLTRLAKVNTEFEQEMRVGFVGGLLGVVEVGLMYHLAILTILQRSGE